MSSSRHTEIEKLVHAYSHPQPYRKHPQDWENPGRVKVHLFDDHGAPIRPEFPTSTYTCPMPVLLTLFVQNSLS